MVVVTTHIITLLNSYLLSKMAFKLHAEVQNE